jgi:tetratricopeptide (TPR) repeat protein
MPEKSSGEQGLFTTHLKNAKTFFDEEQYAAAERQLEEAYLLRPRDPNVLNLLGLVYFKQRKFERAEEIYRKLSSNAPENPTLHYNLGLVYSKLNRWDEAESALLKALELSGTNPKISFYLGAVYEKQQRFQDAIFHYRRAGANRLARQIEDQLGGTGTAQAPAVPTPRRRVRPDEDTAEFKAQEVRDAINQRAVLARPRPVAPVSPALMAPDAQSALDSQRAHAPAGRPQTQPITPPAPVGSDSFRFLEDHLLEIDFSGKVFIKQGTIYSYGGDLTFWVKERRLNADPPLVIITGRGRLILRDNDREISLLRLTGEGIYVDPVHLLACEETLTPRYTHIEHSQGQVFEFVALEGHGIVALSTVSKPLTLAVSTELPVSVPAAAIISWNGALTAHPVADRQIYEVLQRSGSRAVPLIRFEGVGHVMVEQSAS